MENTNYSRFKSLLEYFVAHLEYVQNKCVKETIGYNDYIEPIKDGFVKEGTGYRGARIQNQIKDWDTYNGITICISITNNFKNYKSKLCYLHWNGTNKNIIAEWNDNRITKLCVKNNEDKKDGKSIDELGLFDGCEPNDTLKLLFDNYYKLAISDLDKYIQQLKANHNNILHGAPVTGKTYLSKEIAKAICGDAQDIKTLEDSGQFKMVQFHPSYDYTDFVEGLRPEDDGKGNIVFKRKDGVFKEFCKKAVNASLIKSAPTNNETNIITEKELKNAWDIFVKIIDDNKSIGYKLELDDGKSTPNLTIGEFVKDSAQYENKAGDKRIEWGIREQYCSWGYILNIHREFKCPQMISKNGDIEKVAPGTTHQYLNYIYKKVYEIAGKQVCRANNNPYFIFLIDEINRGDMSKIFGELFYSIDPGYRGEKGKIDTQYQNLVTAKYKDENGYAQADPFHKGFYVPDNVYIIGTMNDIDRSVESMDFAMRRRFQFIEVTAEDSAKNMNIEGEAQKRMEALNKCIVSDKIDLSSAFQIGGSYFLGKDDKPLPDTYNFENLWKYRLEGLLREYLRGEEEHSAKEKMKILKNAFFKDTEQEPIQNIQNEGNTPDNGNE